MLIEYFKYLYKKPADFKLNPYGLLTNQVGHMAGIGVFAVVNAALYLYFFNLLPDKVIVSLVSWGIYVIFNEFRQLFVEGFTEENVTDSVFDSFYSGAPVYLTYFSGVSISHIVGFEGIMAFDVINFALVGLALLIIVHIHAYLIYRRINKVK